jgi:tripartite-type tricarboxylate transporter receptor subunit TctC
VASTRRFVAGFALALSAIGALFSPAANAADWPNRPIRWVVPFGPGGGADVVSRLVAAELSKRLGAQVFIENKPGASSVIGTRQIAEADPDGYTIGLLTVVHPVNVAVGQKIPYNVDTDFAYLSQLTQNPMILVANAKRSFRSLADVVDYAQKNPGKLTAASIGVATPHHLLLKWLASKKGMNMVFVPFKSIPEALQATVSGETDLMLIGAGGAADSFVEKGALTVVGITSRERSRAMPKVATFVEQGLPDFIEESWYGLVAPAKVPADIVKKLGDGIRAALNDEDVKKKITAAGAEPKPSSAADFIALLKRDTEKYQQIVKEIKD